MKWRNLFASIVANTSLTMKDIADLRINEMEELLIGLNENAEAERKELEGNREGHVIEGADAIHALIGDR